MSSLFDQMFAFQIQADGEMDEVDDLKLSPSMAAKQSAPSKPAMATPSLASSYHPMMMMKMMMLNMETQHQHNPTLTQASDHKLDTSPPAQPQPKPTKRVESKPGRQAKQRQASNKVAATSTAKDSEPEQRAVKCENPMYRCHLCSYTGNHKVQFNAHMNTHFDHQCPHCDYTSRTEGRLKRHIRDFHSETPPETWSGNGMLPEELLNGEIDPADLSDDDLAPGGTGPNPARNRKYRCKQCGYVAIEKRDFWEHTRQHIKTDKMLACPKCNFVTEYKHHLEYHLRNHLGSKPFRCGKCNYSCVNKSMLNSHMKSHSNIYQYRCEDCTYATKYCHSLKLHLRKYQHQPATVLNLDGTPNPYPVIDVYGTRRGPRPKKGPRMGPRDRAILAPLKPTKPRQQKIETQAKPETDEPGSPQPNSLAEADEAAIVVSSPANTSNEAKVVKKNQSVASMKSGASANSTILRCNYCPYQTESKPEFSAHMFDHVRSEKLTLLQEKRQKMNATATATSTSTAEEPSTQVDKKVKDDNSVVSRQSPKIDNQPALVKEAPPARSVFVPQQSPTTNLWSTLPPSLLAVIGNGHNASNPLLSHNFGQFGALNTEMISNRAMGKPLDLSKSSPPPPPPPPPSSSSVFPPMPATISNNLLPFVPVSILSNPTMLQLFINNLLISAQANLQEQQMSKESVANYVELNSPHVSVESDHAETMVHSDSETDGSMDVQEVEEEQDDEDQEIISLQDEVLAKPSFAHHQLPLTPMKSPKSTEMFEFAETGLTSLQHAEGQHNASITNMMSLFAQFLQTNPGQTPEESVATFSLMQKMCNATSLMQEIMNEMEAIKK